MWFFLSHSEREKKKRRRGKDLLQLLPLATVTLIKNDQEHYVYVLKINLKTGMFQS